MMLDRMLFGALHGAAVPIVWIIGIVLIIAGIIALFNRSVLLGAVLIIIGVLLGGLNVV